MWIVPPGCGAGSAAPAGVAAPRTATPAANVAGSRLGRRRMRDVLVGSSWISARVIRAYAVLGTAHRRLRSVAMRQMGRSGANCAVTEDDMKSLVIAALATGVLAAPAM